MSEGNELFTVRQSPTSNLGAFANRDLPRLTVILIEEPIIYGDQIRKALEFHKNGTHSSQVDDEMFLALECGVDDATRERVWSMHDQFIPTYSDASQGEKRLFGVIKSNAFTNGMTASGTSKPPQGLYQLAARLNHSCSPNVGFDFVQGNKIRMFTTRLIRKGEELYDTYSDIVYHPKEARHILLQEKFLFDCQCSACSPGDNNQLQKSNERRKRLQELTKLIGERQLGNESTSVEASDLNMLMECIALLTTESIDQNSYSLYKLAYKVAVRLEDAERIEALKELVLPFEKLLAG